jgi:hypothetical protein
LNEERPPPLGDLVDVAIRDGRRIRRIRRLGRLGAGAAVLGVVAVTTTLAGPFFSTPGPHPPAEGVPVAAPASGGPAAGPTAHARTGAGALPAPPDFAPAESVPTPVPVLGAHAVGPQKKVTSGAMLTLLTKLLPPGKTSHYAVAPDQSTHVQLYLDTGRGPGMIRAVLEKDASGGPIAKGEASVSVDYRPDNCVESIVVDAALPDGANLAINVATCLAWDGKQNRPAPPAITAGEAVKIATDPRWGLTMDADLVNAGDKQFPHLRTMS